MLLIILLAVAVVIIIVLVIIIVKMDLNKKNQVAMEWASELVYRIFESRASKFTALLYAASA